MRVFKWLTCTAAVAIVAAAVPALASTTRPGNPEWNEDLSAAAASRVNVTVHGGRLRIADSGTRLGAEPGPAGYLATAPRRLSAAVDRVAVTTDATVPAGSALTIEVRGRDSRDRWTDWTEVAGTGRADLSAEVSVVQFRVSLTGAATVTRLSVRAERRGTVSAAIEAQTVTWQIYATREGLVGGRTANGHIISPRDHFVALPSRRALNVNGGRDYQVRVCYSRTYRCEIAPVWDVGPWNVQDDYWNPPLVRQMWRDLPRGVPEAHAAYANGYNGGRDGFGRRVSNPAGIDLADGTFWDGLGMTNNDFVWVEFKWT
jgi:hypothetical protein